jgi:hypothetical protein
MGDKPGKYIVFCANVTHMREIAGKAREWFARVDKRPRIYMTYAANPAAGREYEAFKQDNHPGLRLLYCIDMLNEGIHVEDISGVILSRPTASPIIYKQQIGRALSADKNTSANPVIFDIVNNFENLCSISAIQEEMKSAIGYYLSQGEEEQIVNHTFTITDETADARALFDRLQESLTASWDTAYTEAQAFYNAHRHLHVPKRYTTGSGFSLGSWLETQRRVRAGHRYGTLTARRIEQLDAIGMIWDNRRERSWEKGFTQAKAYYEAHGHLDIQAVYVSPNGYKLGAWVTNTRQARLQGKPMLTEERINRLNEIGMIWRKFDFAWEHNCAALEAYYKEHGHTNIPHKYTDPGGVRLGLWLTGLRTLHRKAPEALTEEKRSRLNRLGVHWGTKYEAVWEKSYAEAAEYYRIHKHLEVPVAYTTHTGLALGKWIRRQRDAWGKGNLADRRRNRLTDIGMAWVTSACSVLI